MYIGMNFQIFFLFFPTKESLQLNKTSFTVSEKPTKRQTNQEQYPTALWPLYSVLEYDLQFPLCNHTSNNN